MVAFQPNKKSLLNFDIYDHKETPGLGGRISEPAWLAQFKNLPFYIKDLFAGVIIKGAKDKDIKSINSVDGITSASKTVFAVNKALNKTIFQFIVNGKDIEILDLGLDDVTKATPGWPKNLVMPSNFRDGELKRPPVMVSPDTELLSLNKPVSTSMKPEFLPLGPPELLVDGVKRSEDVTRIEFGPGKHWVQIDLEESHLISMVVIWHHYKNATIYNDVIVQLSDDPEFKAGVKTIYNNDHDNSSGMGKGKGTTYASRWWGEIADARDEEFNEVTSARYVRVYTSDGAGAEAPSFVEVSVYGKPADGAIVKSE
jgi:hypothetical protein